MRVIAGLHRGRRLLGPRGQAIRPTSDRVKEALFSILGERTTGARVLDLYAGTGSIGIEALSRGAAHVTFVEADREALRLVHSNLQQCGLEESANICVRHGLRVSSFEAPNSFLESPRHFGVHKILERPPMAGDILDDGGREIGIFFAGH